MVLAKRDSFIDVVKGWGILLVIWGHSSSFLFSEIYAFHMPLFFFLSGCFFKWTVSPADFIKRKHTQLLIPYGIFFLLSFFCYYILLVLTNRSSMISWEMLKGIVPLDNKIQNAPLWFLYALFWMSLIYYGIRKMCKNNLLILFICIGIYCLNYLFYVKKIELPCFLGRSLNELIFMHLGYWGFKSYPSESLLNLSIYKKVFLLFISFGSFCLLFYIEPINVMALPAGINIVTALAGIALCISFALVFQPIKWLSRIMNYLGKHTLCLFALHMPLFEIARPISKLVWGIENMKYDISIFTISLLLSIIMGEILMLIFPKYLGKSNLSNYCKK